MRWSLMTSARMSARLAAVAVAFFAWCAFARATTQSTTAVLWNTSWQLVQFVGGDGQAITPADGGKYTLAFGGDGSVSARIDCNRGFAKWKSPAPGQLELGPLAITRAMCPQGSIHDRFIKDWPFVRGYVIKEQHLFLALMADGGTYEFEPLTDVSAETPPMRVKSKGPLTFQCTRKGGETEMLEQLNVTFYQTEPALALVERAGRTRPAFRVESASGARYEGEELTFWDKGEQAVATWSGMQLACKRR